jgi:geranylgeranyl reductase family protein
MNPSSNSYEVIIAGAGPAGCSTAIHLASRGVKVLLFERKKFPRAKLCGEFISPECRQHFQLLGVDLEIAALNPATLNETVFYSHNGRRVRVPSDWFAGSALGLSRAEMDQCLLERAQMAGVEVLEETSVSDVLITGNQVSGVRLKINSQTEDRYAKVIIDATGRSRTLVKKLNSQYPDSRTVRPRNKLVAFKAHLTNAAVTARTCEIYSYPGGYGGLSSIENGLSNLCLIVAGKDVRRCGSNPETVVRQIVARNSRAAGTLEGARVSSEWLSVSLESFGSLTSVPFPGLLAVGDAAAFIDPFTGSGILMALESGELASTTIMSYLADLNRGVGFDLLSRDYSSGYQRKFGSRLRISGLLRRAAYLPSAANAAIAFFGASERLRRRTAHATRSIAAG